MLEIGVGARTGAGVVVLVGAEPGAGVRAEVVVGVSVVVPAEPPSGDKHREPVYTAESPTTQSNSCWFDTPPVIL